MHRPGREDRDRHEQGRQQNQKQADAVDADDVVDAETGHPSKAFDQLHVTVSAVEQGENFQRPEKVERAREQRDGEERVRLPARHEDQQPRAEHRDRQQNTQMTDRESEHN